MNANPVTASPPCAGCAFLAKRWRGTTPRWLCKRYHQPATVRCIDYIGKGAVAAAITFYEACAK